MVDRTKAVVIGVTAGVAAAALAAAFVTTRTRSLESTTATLRAGGAGSASLDSSVSVSVVSESVADWGHPPPEKRAAFWAWRGGGHNGREPALSVSGIPKYHYKDLQKATSNFTTILGQGSFGPVYKAVMATGEVVAVKVLASDSRQGEREFQTEVGDFGLSKEEVYDGSKSGLKGTYGYMDPDYMSTNKFTKKSDVYSFGIILFELITGINPQQGLMEYINLAAIGGEGRVGWDEIPDKDLLVGNIPEEVRMLADVAYRCINKSPRKRPWISEVTQAISRLRQRQPRKHETLTLPRSETRTVLRRIEYQHVELSDLTSMKERRR